MVVGVEFGGLALVVELEAGRSHLGLQHLFLPVVDGDLQVVDLGLLRREDGLWGSHCPTQTFPPSPIPVVQGGS